MATTEEVFAELINVMADSKGLEVLGIDHEYDLALLKVKDTGEYTILHIEFDDEQQIDKKTGKPKITCESSWSEYESDFGEAVETFHYIRRAVSKVTVYVDDTPKLKIIQGGRDGEDSSA